MNKRISIKGKAPLMAFFIMPLLVSFAISTFYPRASLQVSASSYDLPIGDHEGVPLKPARATVSSDYNPGKTKYRKVNAPRVDHGYYYGKLNTDEKRDLYDAVYIACDSSRRLKNSSPLPDSDYEADVVNKGGYLFYQGKTSRNRYYNAESLECSTVVNEALEALCYDHMANVEYYMCDWMIYEFETDGIYRDYIIMREFTSNDYNQIDQAVTLKAKEYANKVRSLGLVNSGSVAATVLNVHDWYTRQVSYGTTGSTGSSYFNFSHTAYGALCQGKAVCDGYSQGYALILKELGIESRVVTGMVSLSSGKSGGHAWNMVKIDGDWYEEDTTWADTKASGNGGKVNHSYFNRTTSQYYNGIEGNKHYRQAPYSGRLIDTANGIKYTYEVCLSLLSGQEVYIPEDENQPQETSGNQTVNSPENSKIPSASNANTVTINNDANQSIVYALNSEHTASLTSATIQADLAVDIPGTVVINGKEYPVTRIEAKAFEGNSNVSEITGGHNLIYIGKEAFSKCKNLKSVDLSETDIKEIAAKAFNGCSKLKKVKLNGDTLKKVGKKAFNKINKSAKVTIRAKNKKVYNRQISRITKAGAGTAKYKYKKSLGIKYS